MTTQAIPQPLGLHGACTAIEDTCSRADLYRRGGMRPDHLIIPLDPGCGRTTLLEYLTAKYKSCGMLSFTGSREDFMEISFDGTLAQLKQAFSSIEADFANEFTGIVGMTGLEHIAAHLNEAQFTAFLTGCKRICRSACVVFFVGEHPSRNEARLMETLRETIRPLTQLAAEPYTRSELGVMMETAIRQYGISMEDGAALSDTLTALDISTVPEALDAARELARQADFTRRPPVLEKTAILAMTKERSNHR